MSSADRAEASEVLIEGSSPRNVDWKPHRVWAGPYRWEANQPPTDPSEHRKNIEPWLSALLQAEHVSLLVGNGLTTSIAALAGAPAVNMQSSPFECALAGAVDRAAKASGKRCGRDEPNIEDQIRVVTELIAGLRIMRLPGGGDEFSLRAGELLSQWEPAFDERIRALLRAVLETERGIDKALSLPGTNANQIRRLMGSFLLTFASRASTRERLHIFTTNYDRVIEYACDVLGPRVIDRFVGSIKPVFRASRLGIDLHYNPPGIRGEPRYLEGVVRFTKLHGSIDWRQEEGVPCGRRIVRYALRFGASEGHPELPEHPRDGLLVYPNPAKDVETLEYPYAELFRDFAASVCQPNAVLVTYGYGFGDDHINRVLRDMLTIASTHLAILSYDGASGRIARFCEGSGHDEQMTLLLGDHFGDLNSLVEYYLPKPAIDRTTWRMVELLNRRVPHGIGEQTDAPHSTDMG